MAAEISFDLVMKDDMELVEGTYRLSGRDWQVFVFCREAVGRPEVSLEQQWASGATGLIVWDPEAPSLNRKTVLRILSEALNVADWVEVKGPDSMQLR
jgi:hypothetical protein